MNELKEIIMLLKGINERILVGITIIVASLVSIAMSELLGFLLKNILCNVLYLTPMKCQKEPADTAIKIHRIDADMIVNNFNQYITNPATPRQKQSISRN